MMEHAQIGGMPVSVIGFGCAAMGGYDYGAVDDAESIDAVQAAIDNGVDFFDVADIYGLGHAEEVLGRALAGRRDKVRVATKFGLVSRAGRTERNASAAHVAAAVDLSLTRLGIDVIDLYQLHWPDPRTPFAETAEALQRCLDAGKIRAAGVCNISLPKAKEMNEVLPLASIQVAYNLLCRGVENDLLPWCRAEGIALLAHSPLARGFLAPGVRTIEGTDTRGRSRYFADENESEKRAVRDAVAAIAKSRGVSEAAVAVRWVLDRGVDGALAGIRNRQQLEAQLGAVGWSLNEHEMNALLEVSARCPGVMTGELAQ
jgi:aryl-alcohol dehydrogenase-like predicted oxidoreductase